MRQLWIATVALILSLATAAPSFAARAEMAFEQGRDGGRWMVLWVTAGAGEHNDLVLTGTGGEVRVEDSAPVTAGGFCHAQADGSALCQPWQGFRIEVVHIKADDLDDSVRSEVRSVKTYLSGGTGNDLLTAVVVSSLPTEFNGGPGDDRMIGGPAVDHFVEDSAANGSDLMVGGTEGYRPLTSYYHGDEVSYRHRANPIRADLEGDRDDGEQGEGDQIGADVETIVGGSDADVLGGNASENFLDGSYGADLLSGGGGNDRLRGGHVNDKSADRLLGGPGRDYLTGGGGSDSLYGGPGGDALHGGSGRDQVRPGAGYDRIFGGPGNDMFWTRDRRIEVVQCGAGWDRVLPDRLEQLEADCERDLSKPRRVRR